MKWSFLRREADQMPVGQVFRLGPGDELTLSNDEGYPVRIVVDVRRVSPGTPRYPVADSGEWPAPNIYPGAEPKL